ncbi:HSF-type DNA-binding-domain-containing protein [Cokeromyces recurvatus]|uniref:HSF-type DNA-binding-domain-containing protein n=1 Tax=Cokeromyces recurvatus TaxID=90255 RepID=UPI0022202D76|nr:HSF-type DNA-binding-domain-containing protein [Cokeromyces recurvatus]KAI7906297.1 HSF-type DNA-binding-domain-containing protein [Cokeromyces recurvatus]
MSGLDSLHITVPQPNSYMPYNNHRNSLSSNSSSNNSSNDRNWEPHEIEDSHRRSTKRGVSTFISKLFSMVSDRCNQHLISWNPSGTSFLVCNATRFSQEILPEHFKHSNFSSFVRQLNMYGFHKINKSPRGQRGNNENEIWEFSHPKFQRGRPDILEDIKRKAMDSELLRRETGDIHASFAMVQLSQADLLQQFRVLQENFGNLLQGFEELKKIQLQQQIIIRRLAERQGLPIATSLNDYELAPNNGQPSVFITSPTASSYEPLQHQQQHWDEPQPQMIMPSIYHHNNNTNSNLQQHPTFSFPLVQNPLPPSPVSSVLLSSPSSPTDEQQQCDLHNSNENNNNNNNNKNTFNNNKDSSTLRPQQALTVSYPNH